MALPLSILWYLSPAVLLRTSYCWSWLNAEPGFFIQKDITLLLQGWLLCFWSYCALIHLDRRCLVVAAASSWQGYVSLSCWFQDMWLLCDVGVVALSEHFCFHFCLFPSVNSCCIPSLSSMILVRSLVEEMNILLLLTRKSWTIKSALLSNRETDFYVGISNFCLPVFSFSWVPD